MISLSPSATSWELLDSRVGSRPQNCSEPLLVPNLLNNLQELAGLLQIELEKRSWLNAYLLAAGMNQIAEDFLHPDILLLGKAADFLEHIDHPLASISAKMIQVIRAFLGHAQEARIQTRRVLKWQRELATLVQILAEAVACPEKLTRKTEQDAIESGQMLLKEVNYLPPGLLKQLLRLPSCFRSFDQQPADLERISQNFSQKWPERSRPIAVIGIRTSGSYLAPLYTAYLGAIGYKKITCLTLRPGRRCLQSEKAALRALVRNKGLALISDDPPATGKSLLKAIKDLEQVGLSIRSMVLLLQLFGSTESLPEKLQGYQAVLLPWEAWSIHQKLEPTNVQATLSGWLAPDVRIHRVERIPLPERDWARSHVRGRYRVQVSEPGSDQIHERDINAQGAGLGYFGEHSLAMTHTLPGFLPTVYGLSEGLLFQEGLSAGDQLTPFDPGEETWMSAAMANYVVARSQAFPVDEDVSLRMLGQMPVWEAASNLLSGEFGRGWPLARLSFIDKMVKRLLVVKHPSVIDGSMGLSHWFTNREREGALLKADYATRDFSNLDLTCYDPVYDLAGISPGSQNSSLAKNLRQAYEEISGETIDEEHWLLYSLVHLWDRGRQLAGEAAGMHREMAQAMQRYFEKIYFADLEFPSDGPLCALDIDGVLETNALGFPSLTSASALSLRALTLHGYRPILASGRSLDEVKERCLTYRLAGGVAEYGAAIFCSHSGEVRPLLSNRQAEEMTKLREALSKIDGVHLDSDYRFAVRAYRLDSEKRRCGLTAGMVTEAFTRAHASLRIRAVPGEGQTDFIPNEVNKGMGLLSLVDELIPDFASRDQKLVALAVGDTGSDLPMLRLAEQAFAPANADIHLKRSGVKILGHPYQSGLESAVSHFLGHKPGNCPICQGPPLSYEARLLLELLAIQETGKWGKIRRAAQLALKVR